MKNNQSSDKARRVKLHRQNVQDKIASNAISKVRINSIDNMRIHRALAMSGIASRRACEALVSEGRVLVNNKIANIGQIISPNDKVSVNGVNVVVKWPDRLAQVIIYHKVDGEITTRHDPDGRVTVFSKIPLLRNKRFVSIGRLDINTSGLLIFTNSGNLANRFTHPRYQVEREYAVRIFGQQLTPSQLKILTTTGVTLDDGVAVLKSISYNDSKHDNTDDMEEINKTQNHWYRVVITEGKNREVRRIFESFGCVVSRLIRVRFGSITLPPRLKRGQFYELNPLEVKQVMNSVGLDIAGNETA